MNAAYKTSRLLKASFAILAMATLSACASHQDAQRPMKVYAFGGMEKAQTFKDKVAEFEALYRQHPEDLRVIIGLSRAYRNAGAANRSLALLDGVGAQFSSDSSYLAERGKVLVALGRFGEGVTQLERATEINPKDWQAFSAAGIAHDQSRQYQFARSAYRQALQICPDHPAVMNNLGISLALAGDVDGAIETLEDAKHFGRHVPQIERNIALFNRLQESCPDCANVALGNLRATLQASNLSAADSDCLVAAQTSQALVAELTPALDQDRPSIDIQVLFEFASSVLKQEAQTALDRLGEALSSDALKPFRFEIAGHTDSVGSDIYNQDLSERRAWAVRDYLVAEHGVDPDRLETVGFGESQLLDPEAPTSEVNRRVQVTLLGHE